MRQRLPTAQVRALVQYVLMTLAFRRHICAETWVPSWMSMSHILEHVHLQPRTDIFARVRQRHYRFPNKTDELGGQFPLMQARLVATVSTVLWMGVRVARELALLFTL